MKDFKNWTRKFVDYCSGFEPRVGELLEGASDLEISRLETLCGQVLPLEYRQFLELMGRKQAKILYGYMSAIDIDEAIEIYDEINGSQEQSIPEDYLIIGSGSFILEHEVCLINSADKPSQVYHFVNGKRASAVAQSLPHLLFQQAFNCFQFQPRSRKMNFAVNRSQPTLIELRQAANLCGFSFKSFSDDINLCAFKGDMVLSAQLANNDYRWLSLAGECEEEMEGISKALEKQVSVKRLKSQIIK